jgi:hypothetical protein
MTAPHVIATPAASASAAPSVLMLSVGVRLGLAASLIAGLWLAVLWALA